ncbi:MAG: SUMF1/EgtB/PvdO family nonheme iron enzyme [Verrucomicrobiota bacterium]|nr:SUMF1/EgtB/PvdO family nonheme iron enzyme [Verrucomicrobiota bacterium]
MPTVAPDRTPPKVPNHEMVRIIGQGAYGEIWLARSLTGTWRAVKIVDRQTFRSDKAFQREFEGMARFEPISRGHDGFVDILHVGRDEDGGFFYYVMELADDHAGGARVDPAHYVPKTLKSELARRSRLLVDECIALGLSITQALSELHRQGLVHRDIKPANIIFVGGQPKIADIGLVASRGQLSFVGTEGYIPPEGPGTVQADLYSLGKVLYEIAMGKDRLDFPELNPRLAELPDKVALLQLNEILLRACANNPAQRYASAEELHDDLVRLRDGQPLAFDRRPRWGALVAGLGVLALAAGGAYFAWLHTIRGDVLIETDPPGAMVAFDGTMKPSPAHSTGLRVGRKSAHVMFAGFDPVDVRFKVEPNGKVRPPLIKLNRSRGAVRIETKPPGATFELREGRRVVSTGIAPATVSDLPTGSYALLLRLDAWKRMENVEITRGEEAVKEVAFKSGQVVISSKPEGAGIFIDGKPIGAAPLELQLPDGPHEIVAKFGTWPEQRQTIAVDPAMPATVAFEFARGRVKITSRPSGASVLQSGQEIGRTPLALEDLEPGEVQYELRLADFKPVLVHGVVEPGQQTFLPAQFLKRVGAQRGQPWKNSLGMKFVPVGDALMSIWPTRVQDFDLFCQATGRARVVPDFTQNGTHPVVNVNWEDADDFCRWLTQWEMKAEWLAEGQQYRLPTDPEWSLAAGLPNEGGSTPEERDGKLRDFPWGKQWPPPPGAGNYADSSLRRSSLATIPGYQDRFAQTSPAGTFPANALGLHDIGGNVWQWCHELYKPGSRWGVLRGGSWATADPDQLRAGYRYVVDRAERDVIYGFRAVLVPEPAR